MMALEVWSYGVLDVVVLLRTNTPSLQHSFSISTERKGKYFKSG